MIPKYTNVDLIFFLTYKHIYTTYEKVASISILPHLEIYYLSMTIFLTKKIFKVKLHILMSISGRLIWLTSILILKTYHIPIFIS